MIISKKKFNQMVEERVNQEMNRIDRERWISDRISSLDKQFEESNFDIHRRIERIEKELGLEWNKYPF